MHGLEQAGDRKSEDLFAGDVAGSQGTYCKSVATNPMLVLKGTSIY